MKIDEMRSLYSKNFEAVQWFKEVYEIAVNSIESIPDEDIKELLISHQIESEFDFILSDSKGKTKVVFVNANMHNGIEFVTTYKQSELEKLNVCLHSLGVELHSIIFNLYDKETVQFLFKPPCKYGGQTLKWIFGNYLNTYDKHFHLATIDSKFFV